MDKTKWISDAEFKFSVAFMKLMAFFMGKKAFQKQSMSLHGGFQGIC